MVPYYRYEQEYEGEITGEINVFEYDYERKYTGKLFKTDIQDVNKYYQMYEGEVTEIK